MREGSYFRDPPVARQSINFRRFGLPRGMALVRMSKRHSYAVGAQYTVGAGKSSAGLIYGIQRTFLSCKHAFLELEGERKRELDDGNAGKHLRRGLCCDAESTA